MVMGELRLVWLLLFVLVPLPPPENDGWDEPMVVRRSVSVSVTFVTCARDLTFAISDVVSALLTLEKLLKPAGEIVTVLPIELLTSAIFWLTA